AEREGELSALRREGALPGREAELEGELKELKNLKKERERKEKLLEKLRAELAETEREAASLASALAERTRLFEERLQSFNQRKEELKRRLREAVLKVFGKEEVKRPDELVRFLREEVETFRRNYERLTEEVGKLSVALSKVEGELSLLREERERLEDLLSGVEERLRRLREEVKELGLKPSEVEKLLPRLRTFPELLSRLQEKEGRLRSLEAELESLSAKLGPSVEEDLKRLEELRNLLKEKEERLEELKVELAKTSDRLREVKEALRQKEELLKEKERLEERLALLEALLNDLRSDRLPDFVVGRAIEEVVELAGEYLYRLTERYRFRSEGGKVEVLDLFTDAARPVESLSGGETFLASLAFALGFGEYLGSGAAVESLFIDEGFGTLDRDALTKVGELFELIKTRVERVVGVITHVDAVADLFERQIRVVPSPAGSKIEVI
ncbi:MAG: hypothetical protein GXO08_05415, partial [Aquificae bacterium]|nr:hypothetical protein [Aquificota bacterium]